MKKICKIASTNRIKKSKKKQLSIVNCQLSFFLAILLTSCTQDNVLVINTNESTVHRVNFIETAHSANADSLYHRFNILNIRTDNKELIGDIKFDEIETVTSDTPLDVEGIRRLPTSGGTVPDNCRFAAG